MNTIVLLGGQPYSQYRVVWKSLISKLYPNTRIFTVSLEVKAEYSSVALRGKAEAIDWDKLIEQIDEFHSNPANSRFEVELESVDDANGRILVCSDPLIMSAPFPILDKADLVIITYANEDDTFRNMILLKEDSKYYREHVWPSSVKRFHDFEKNYFAFEAALREKIIFVDDTASIQYFLQDNLTVQEGESKARYSIGIRGDLAKALKATTQVMSKKEASARMIDVRTNSKALFRRNAEKDISDLLNRYPQSHDQSINFVLDRTNRESVESILMSSEEYKSLCQAIITQKYDVVNSNFECRLSLANIFTKHTLEFWKRTDPSLYQLEDSQSLIIFVELWRRNQGAGVEPHLMTFLAEDLRLSLRNTSAIRRLCTKLYVVHNFFCIDNPSIFSFVVHLLHSKNPMFVDLGIGLLADILKMRSAERFAKYFRDEEQRLTVNVAVAALEGLGHLFKPVRDYLKVGGQQNSQAEAEKVGAYLSNLSAVLSSDIWEAFDMLFWGLSQHATMVRPWHVRNLLEPLVFVRKHCVYRESANELLVSIVAIMHYILRYGTTDTVNMVMSFAGELAEIASVQIRDEINQHIGESGLEVLPVTGAVEKVLLSILNLLERTGVPCTDIMAEEIEDGAMRDVEIRKSATSSPALSPPMCSKPVQDFHRLEDMRTDFVRLKQLEAEKTLRENVYQANIKDYCDRVACLEAKLNVSEGQLAESTSRESELISRIQLLEKENQELLAAIASASSIRGSEESREKPEQSAALRVMQIQTSKDHVQTAEISSLEFVRLMEEGTIPTSLEEMKRFIRIIHEERVNIPLALRPSFCGMLKHLGEDLYSSQAHFMQEMLQNADDNTFHPGESPAMYVFLVERNNVESITIGNNEVGMTAKDVLALCSAASSKKTAGLQTGQKGLGFKSVYACCRSPVIISKGWRFQFNADSAGCMDEMAYIDPHWIDENPDDVNAIIATLGDQAPAVRTIIHLPLKPSVKLETLSKGLRSALSPVVLLCAHKLKNIHIYRMGPGELFGQPSSVTCQAFDLETMPCSLQLPGGFSLATNHLQKWRAKLTCQERPGEPWFSGIPWESDGSMDFLAFEAELSYPRENKAVCGERRQQSDRPSVIRVLFPLTDRVQDWPVCATLPVCHVGLPFILQADWDVVTSRESIKMSLWNKLLADCFLAVLQFVFTESSEIGSNLSRYLVKVCVEGDMKPFWKDFESNLRFIVDAQLPRNCVLANAAVDSLKIPDSLIWRCVGLQIVRNNSADVPMDVLLHCRRRMQVEDVLKCFQDGLVPDFLDWAESQDPEWWAKLFELLLETFKKSGKAWKSWIIDLARRQPLFLLNLRQPQVSRDSDPPCIKRSKVTFSDSRTLVLICIGSAHQERFYTWRKEITVLRHSSSAELAFLREVLSIPVADPDLIMDKILDLHRDFCFAESEPWGDLLFISSLFAGVSHSNHEMHLDDLGKRLRAPTTTKGHMPVCDCTLMTLMGKRIADPHRLLHGYSVDAPVICVEVTGCELGDTARIEKLLINLGCRYPPAGAEPDSVQSLPSLSMLSRRDVECCLSLLRQCPPHLRNYLSRCHLALHGDENQTEEARLTFATSVSSARDLLPCVLVPDFAMDLAEAFGVGTKMTFGCAIRAMLALVQRKCMDVTAYTTWLAYCQSFQGTIEKAMQLNASLTFVEPATLNSSEDAVYSTRCWIECIRKNDFIAAEVEMAPKIRHLPADWLFCPFEEAMDDHVLAGGPQFTEAPQQHISFVVARLLGKAVVCRHSNGALSPFVGVLRSMGCKAEPDLSDAVLALQALRATSSSYIRGGKGIMLTPAAIHDVFALCRHINLLLGNMDDVAKRRDLLASVMPNQEELDSLAAGSAPESREGDPLSNQSSACAESPRACHRAVGDMCSAFPLLLSDYSFPVGLHPTEVFQNPYDFFAEALREAPIKLLHHRLSEECSLLCEVLGIGHLKDRTVSYFRTSLGENIPRFMWSATEAFNGLLSRPVQLLKVVYVDLMVYIMDGHVLRVHDDRKLTARSDHTDDVMYIDSPAHPQARVNPHLQSFEVFSESAYVVAGDIIFLPAAKTDAAWRLVLNRLLAQLLMVREGLQRAAAEARAFRALQRVDLRDGEGWKGFDGTLHMNSSDVEFPSALTGNFGAGDGDLEYLSAVDETVGDSSSSNVVEGGGKTVASVSSHRQLPLAVDSRLGRLNHIDRIFQARIESSCEGEGGIKFDGLDPKAFSQLRLGGVEGETEPTTVDARSAEWVGLLGERFASLQLQKAYPESFDPTRHWVSSARLKFYPASRTRVDDTLGYDMEVHDTRGLFVAGGGGNSSSSGKHQRVEFAPGGHRRCFVEVKSTAGPFRGVFHLSRNELRVREMCAELANARSHDSPPAN